MNQACLTCRVVPNIPNGDHCHKHGHQRGPLCTRCNLLMRFIDAGRAPRVTPSLLGELLRHAGRCPECPPLNTGDLIPVGVPVNVNALLADEQYEHLRGTAHLARRSMNDILREALDAWFRASAKKEKP